MTIEPRRKFLVDANILITPYRQYYPFDFAPSFWEQMEENIVNGNICICKKVYDEIVKNNDDLSTWLRNICDAPIKEKEAPVLAAYGEIMEHINTCGFYKSSALNDWARNEVADPWIVAHAIARKEFVVVTHEAKNNNLSLQNPSKRIKIPDVCDYFEVERVMLFDAMRVLAFRL